jgi:cell cycle checkpoint protein
LSISWYALQEDLAIQKKKVGEVKQWLLNSFDTSSYGASSSCGIYGYRVLVLNGPAGCGKSATLRVLAKHLGLVIQEWINPSTITWTNAPHNNNINTDNSSMGHSPTEPRLQQFANFLKRVSGHVFAVSVI